jgi:hypothetical protein
MDVMAERFSFNLVYDGPALQEHRMDVRALAPALLALGELVERANDILNGDQAKVSVDVRASFREGSFGIELDLAQSLWQKVLDLGGNHPVASIATLAGLLGLSVKDGIVGVVQLIRWVRGRSIRRIEPIEGGTVRFLVDDEAIEVEERVYKLLQDYKLRRALQGVIAEPLEREGIESVAVVDKKARHVGFLIEQEEARFFVAPDAQEEELASEEYTATLQVLTLAFQDGNKWRFTEGGGNAFFANILDDGFLQRIRSNEQFARDDIIRARVRRTQRLTKDGLKAEYEIVEVLEHRSATPKVQLKMDFSTNPEKGQ